jgi:MFS family permease
MKSAAVAEFFSGRVHYAWVDVLRHARWGGVRAAPGVMILPLERAFGWSLGTISSTVSINIILLGFTGPLLTGLVQVIGLKRTILACMGLLAAGTGLSLFMTAPWQLFITWGLMVGIGAGGGAVGVAAAIANRWFVARSGLAMGLLSAENAAGQLAFLPLLAPLAEQYGWQGVAVAVTVAIAAMVPVVAILLPESPADIGLGPYGATADRGRRAPSGQSDRNRDDNIVPRCTIARLLAADPQFRDLRVHDEWADQHAPDRLLRRSRYWRSNRGQHFGDTRRVASFLVLRIANQRLVSVAAE